MTILLSPCGGSSHIDLIGQFFVDPSEESDWVIAHSLRQSTKLDYVYTPDPSLNDRDQRLLAPDALRQLGLCKAGLLARGDQHLGERPISFGRLVFGHRVWSLKLKQILQYIETLDIRYLNIQTLNDRGKFAQGAVGFGEDL